ncbi:hypothetical protein CPV34_17750 [Salmonella enterica]|nr:hypothetical protein [Salmonella enterica]
MITIYQPVRGMKMLKFEDIRNKYVEVVRLQREERECLQLLVKSVIDHFEESLELEQKSWTIAGERDSQNYVFIAVQRDGGEARVDLHELVPDSTGTLSFYVGITVDKSPIAFPKINILVPLSLRRENGAFSLVVGKDKFETMLSEKPIKAELESVSEAISNAAMLDLDCYVPVR